MSFYSAGGNLWREVLSHIFGIDTKEHGKKRKRKQ